MRLFPEPKDRYLLEKYYAGQKDFSEETYDNLCEFMKTFDWDGFMRDKFLVRCKTKKETENFLKASHGKGMKWWAGESLLDNPIFEEEKEYNWYENCSFGMVHSSGEVYMVGKVTILEWNDYMEFTKEDLKVGMIVEVKSGSMVVMPYESGCVLSYPNGKTVDLGSLEFNNINKVWSLCNCAEHVLDFTGCGRHLIYERPTAKEMTVEEISKALGYDVKVVKG